MRDLVSHSRLLQVLNYNPETGIFRWKEKVSDKVVIGAVAGCLRDDGYWIVSFDKKRYLANRLAWFYVTGNWPIAFVDHKDTNRSNNIFANLRPATNSQNLCNRGKQVNNKSGFKGVSPREGRWAAQIRKDNVLRWLGIFDTPEEASKAYLLAAQKWHGEFIGMA